MLLKYTTLVLGLMMLISCQASKEDIQKKYEQANTLQQEAIEISKKVDSKFNQTRYLIGELAKAGFQNPAVIDIMNRFTIVEEKYNTWKKSILPIPGYGTAIDKAALKDAPSPEEATKKVQESLNSINAIYKEIDAVYTLANQ